MGAFLIHLPNARVNADEGVKMENKTFTQEELNQVISDRLGKEKDKMASLASEWEEKAKGYESQIANLTKTMEEMKKAAANHKAELDERDAKIRGYETQAVKMRVAREFNIPYELASRLSGDTEDDIKKDAQYMKGLLDNQRSTIPSRSTEGRNEAESKSDSALRRLASSAFNN